MQRVARVLCLAALFVLPAPAPALPAPIVSGWTIGSTGVDPFVPVGRPSTGLTLQAAVQLPPEAAGRGWGVELRSARDGDVMLLDDVVLAVAGIAWKSGVGSPRADVIFEVPPARALPGPHVLSVRLAARDAREPLLFSPPTLGPLVELLDVRDRRRLPRLVTSVATGSFALLSFLFFLRDPRRRELGLYALFALGISLFLCAGLGSGGAPSPLLTRGRSALGFLLPATGYLFLVRFLELPLGRLRVALLALCGCGVLATLAAPVDDRVLAWAAGGALFALGGELLVALGRRARKAPSDTALLFIGTSVLLLAALLDAAGAHGALAIDGIEAGLLGPAFLVFTSFLLVVVADEGRRLLLRATTDPLTGVANRADFMRRTEAELARAERTGGTLALVMLDVDRFKSYNDRFGHQAGDRVLTAAAQAIAETVRGLDVVGRYGGEEFIVLLVNAAEISTRPAVERIRASVGALEPPRVPEPVTISAGVAFHNGLFERTSVAALIRRADQALYEAKEGGRDRTVLERSRAGPPKTAADVRYR